MKVSPAARSETRIRRSRRTRPRMQPGRRRGLVWRFRLAGLRGARRGTLARSNGGSTKPNLVPARPDLPAPSSHSRRGHCQCQPLWSRAGHPCDPAANGAARMDGCGRGARRSRGTREGTQAARHQAGGSVPHQRPTGIAGKKRAPLLASKAGPGLGRCPTRHPIGGDSTRLSSVGCLYQLSAIDRVVSRAVQDEGYERLVHLLRFANDLEGDLEPVRGGTGVGA